MSEIQHISTKEEWEEFWRTFDQEKFIAQGIAAGQTREEVIAAIEYSRSIGFVSVEELQRRNEEALTDPRVIAAVEKLLQQRPELRKKGR